MSGGPAGEVRYPPYIETKHSGALDNLQAIVEAYNAPGYTSPYNGFTTIEPSSVFGTVTWNVNSLLDHYKNTDDDIEWNYAFDDVTGEVGTVPSVAAPEFVGVDTDDIDNLIDAERTLLSDQLDSDVIPRFEAGMRDINAVVSSAFVIGKALLEDGIDKQIIKSDAELRLQATLANAEARTAHNQISAKIDIANASLQVETKLRIVTAAIQRTQLRMEVRKSLVGVSLEMARLFIAAQMDTDSLEAEMGAKDHLFRCEVYQYLSNLYAAPAGGTMVPNNPGPSVSTALGGALSGAAIGFQAGSSIPGGGPIGAVLGGLVGLLGGLF